MATSYVLITGATGGIGGALAQTFHAQGAHICLTGRNVDALKALKEKFPERCDVFPMDLSKRGEVSALIPAIEKQIGTGVDVLINNGGITKDQMAVRMQDEAWDSVLEVNLSAAFILIRDVARGMMKKKNGRIINITSVVGVMGNPGQANYAASKAGLIGLTKTMALELSRWNITVNAIAPGYIATDMTKKIPEDIAAEAVKRIPLQRMGTPEEVAYWAACLANPLSGYMTGQVVHVNGGLWIG